MSSTLRAVLTGVRDLSPWFDDRYTPNAVLLRAFNRYQARLLAKIADPKRDALIQESTVVTLSSYSWSDDPSVGATLPESIEWLGGDVVFSDSDREPEDLTLVPFHRRNQPFFRWGAWINPRTVVSAVRAPILKLLGVEANWTGVATIRLLRAQKLLGPLTELDSTFTVPGDSDDALVTYGATVCARRAKQQKLMTPEEAQEFFDEWAIAEEAYIDQVTGRKRAQVGPGREAW